MAPWVLRHDGRFCPKKMKFTWEGTVTPTSSSTMRLRNSLAFACVSCAFRDYTIVHARAQLSFADVTQIHMQIIL